MKKKNKRKILKKNNPVKKIKKSKPRKKPVLKQKEKKISLVQKKAKSKLKEKKVSSNKNICVKIIGVGGAGGNVVSRMKEKRIEGVEFIAINTDIQGLQHTKSDLKIQIGGIS